MADEQDAPDSGDDPVPKDFAPDTSHLASDSTITPGPVEDTRITELAEGLKAARESIESLKAMIKASATTIEVAEQPADEEPERGIQALFKKVGE